MALLTIAGNMKKLMVTAGLKQGYDREFMNAKFSNKVEDLGVFCAVTDVDDLQRKNGYEQARYKNVFACDTSRLREITYVRRLATFDSKSCNFPLSHLK